MTEDGEKSFPKDRNIFCNINFASAIYQGRAISAPHHSPDYDQKHTVFDSSLQGFLST